MPAAVQHSASRLIRSTAELTAGPARWVPAAVLAGLVPLALAHAARLPLSQGTTAVLLALLLLPAAAEGRHVRGLATIGLVFATHSGLAILLSVGDASAHAVLPGAADYWEQTRRWIITGQNTEYEPSVWLPIHLGTLGGVAVSSYLSMGVIAFWQGFEQVDMMNFYVGRLLVDLPGNWHGAPLVRDPKRLAAAIRRNACRRRHRARRPLPGRPGLSSAGCRA